MVCVRHVEINTGTITMATKILSAIISIVTAWAVGLAMLDYIHDSFLHDETVIFDFTGDNK